MQCAICRSSAFSRLWPLQTRAPQQHNRTVLAFAEFKAKGAEGVGLTCRVVVLVPVSGPSAAATPSLYFVPHPRDDKTYWKYDRILEVLPCKFAYVGFVGAVFGLWLIFNGMPIQGTIMYVVGAVIGIMIMGGSFMSEEEAPKRSS